MSEQPEALRLADALDAWDGTLMMPAGWRQRTSAELRRLAAIEAQRDALKQTLHDELAVNLRLRDLGVARPDEPMLTFLERIIAERDALLEALNMAVQWVEEYASQMRAYTTSEQANADLSVIYAAIKMAEEKK